jgi:pilus assembly protein Flp/PilA
MYLYLWLKNWFESDEGQGLVEYALIIVLVSIALIAGLTLLAGGINNVFTTINTTLRGTGS